jgi:ABC-type branched-subunit amino acid transport system ATPase component
MLEVKNLHVCYGVISALQGVSLSVKAGSIVTLIGANGAGKSTTLRAISGLVKPRGGEILFNGKNISGLPAHEIVKLGLSHVPEGPDGLRQPDRSRKPDDGCVPATRQIRSSSRNSNSYSKPSRA